MISSPPVRMILTHMAAAAGGIIAVWLKIPLPWMIGPLVVVAILGLSGVPVGTHKTVRDCAIVVMMTALGLTFTPAAARAAASLLPEMVVASVLTVVIGAAVSRVLMATARVDPVTAFFCSVPGGPVEMSLMGERNGARVPEIAMNQLLRIVLLVVIIPTAITLSGMIGDVPTLHSRIPVQWLGLALTILISFTLALVGRRLGLQTAFLLMPMSTGVVLGVSEANLSSVPPWLTNACQIAMGTYLGSQFRRETVRALRRFIPAAILNVLLLTAGCAALGALIAVEAGVSWPTMVLATAPGSVTEMAITAKVLQFDVPMVTAFHLIRIFIVLATVPLVFAALNRIGFFGRPDTTVASVVSLADARPTEGRARQADRSPAE